MKIGISSPLEHSSAVEWAEKQKELGCTAVIFPVDCSADEKTIADYYDAAMDHNLVIAEVGIWKNVMARDPAEREAAREFAIGQLRLADRIGALCCVNIAGTYGGTQWDGGYAENFTTKCWNATVEYIQKLLDDVKPKKTKFSLEPMPWMIPTGPDEYLRLYQEIDREAFGMHLDAVNMINCPKRYFHMDSFLEECFDKLGEYILSCHLKDIQLLPQLTFQLRECRCGEGSFPIEHYFQLIERNCAQTPVLIEHLTSDMEYRDCLNYVRNFIPKNE